MGRRTGRMPRIGAIRAILGSRALEKLAFWGLAALWVLWLVGQAFRDLTLLTSWLFYLPSPLLAAALVGGAGWRLWGKQWVGGAILAALAAAPAGMVLCVENRLVARGIPADGAALRLVHWNVFDGSLGWAGMQRTIRQSQPDICVFAEIPRNADMTAAADSFGEGWTALRFGRMAVLARGALEEGEWLHEVGGVEAYGVVWQSPQGPCRVLVVDLDSSVFSARGPRLRMVRDLMVEWSPDIVVGDLNAPRRSRGLCPLPAGFVHAYDAVGSGWSYTWPVPFPMYAIDQCITGTRVVPLAYVLRSSWRSDHRRQVLDFSLVPEGGGAGSD